MEHVQILLGAGRSAVEFTLFLMLPIMIVMLTIMRLLEAVGVLDWIVKRLAPIVAPFGLNGLGVFGALQVTFISSTAPVSTLAMMEQRGVSDRHLAASLAMVFAMPQANAAFPMIAMGLNFSTTLIFSLIGGLVAASATYYLTAKMYSAEEAQIDEHLSHPIADSPKGVLDVVNRAGWEATKIAIGAIPMLVISLVAVSILRDFGFITWLTETLTPMLSLLHVDPILVLPTLTKYLAGGTAMMGIVDDLSRTGQLSTDLINASAGFLIHPLDVPGFAVLVAAGARVRKVWKAAALGASIGILVRTIGHILA